MKILLYSTDSLQADQLENIFVQNFPNPDISVCKTFEHLSSTARTVYSFSAVVLIVENKEELLELLTIKEVLEGAKVILVLPNCTADLTKLALKLYPRYMTDTGENFSATIDVMRKIFSASSEVIATNQAGQM